MDSSTLDLPPSLDQKIEGTYTPFSPETEVVICIPCHDQEKGIIHALYTYLHLEDSQRNKCEVCVLVNTVEGEECHLLNRIRSFATAHPALKISVYMQGYEENVSLSRVSGDLFRVVKERSTGLARPPLVVSHHADLLRMAPDYIDNLLAQFNEDPDLDLIAGFTDYPKEDFHQDHLFYAVQSFEDILEYRLREKTGKVNAHGGNTAFRLRALDKAGFEDSFESSNAPVYLTGPKKTEGINSRADDEVIWVLSSARRQMSALGTVPPVLLADRYQQSIKMILSESAHKVTSANFADELAKQLTAIYQEMLKNKPFGESEEVLSALFLETASELGLSIELEGAVLKVTDISILKERVLKDFSSF